MRAYNEADQPVTGANGQGAYVYDPLGRQTSIPAADTVKPANGAMSLAYYDSDAAQLVAQGDVRVTFTLDGAGRRLVQNTTVGPVVTPDVVAGTVTRHYTDSSDNPAWTVDVRGGQSVTTRFAGLTGDGMGITFTTINGTTTAELALAGLRGDVNATVKLDGTNPANGIDTWSDYTEYGQPTTTKTATAGGAASAGYGWLGAHERATLDALGITLMGARLYNQATGLFTSLDPIYGGNESTYGYPNDPINSTDISGQGRLRDFWRNHRRAIIREAAFTAIGFIPGVGAAAWGYRAYRGYKLARGGVYVVRTARGGRYVGQSGHVGRRLSQHVASGKITKWQARTARVYRVKGGKTRREVAEQRMINRLGGIRRLDNRVNPIGRRRQHLMSYYHRNWRGL